MTAAMGSTGSGVKTVIASIDKTAGRLLYLDNLKAFLICLIIYTHAAQPYGMGGGWWTPPQPASPLPNLLISIVLSMNAAFALGLFFLISAYFTPGSYDRKGAGKYLKDRLIRFGIPIVAFVFLIFPVMRYFLYSKGQSFPDFYISTLPGNISAGHLWFVVQLLFFAMCYIAIRKISGTRKLQAIKFPGDLAIVGFILLMAVSMFIVRIWSPVNTWSPLNFVEPAHYPQYILMFAAGIIAYRNKWLGQLTPRIGRKWLNTGFASLLILFSSSILWGNNDMWGGLNPSAFFYALYESIMCVGMSIGLISLFRERFGKQGKVMKAMADDSFAVYLFHIPVVVALQAALIGVSINPLFKFIIVLALGIPLSFLVSHIIRNLPYAKHVL